MKVLSASGLQKKPLNVVSNLRRMVREGKFQRHLHLLNRQDWRISR